jgi:predicted dinucleotide-utilizing enzyme
MESSTVMKVGILGVGAIGQMMAEALDRGGQERAVLVAIADQDRDKAEQFAMRLTNVPPIVSLDELVRRADLIV